MFNLDSYPCHRFLYALFLAINTNFWLIRHNVSSDAIDPRLNRGYAFFVEETEYKDILASRNRVGNAQEVSQTQLPESLHWLWLTVEEHVF
jgi:hypothetical protein